MCRFCGGKLVKVDKVFYLEKENVVVSSIGCTAGFKVLFPRCTDKKCFNLIKLGVKRKKSIFWEVYSLFANVENLLIEEWNFGCVEKHQDLQDENGIFLITWDRGLLGKEVVMCFHCGSKYVA